MLLEGTGECVVRSPDLQQKYIDGSFRELEWVPTLSPTYLRQKESNSMLLIASARDPRLSSVLADDELEERSWK